MATGGKSPQRGGGDVKQPPPHNDSTARYLSDNDMYDRMTALSKQLARVMTSNATKGHLAGNREAETVMQKAALVLMASAEHSRQLQEDKRRMNAKIKELIDTTHSLEKNYCAKIRSLSDTILKMKRTVAALRRKLVLMACHRRKPEEFDWDDLGCAAGDAAKVVASESCLHAVSSMYVDRKLPAGFLDNRSLENTSDPIYEAKKQQESTTEMHPINNKRSPKPRKNSVRSNRSFASETSSGTYVLGAEEANQVRNKPPINTDKWMTRNNKWTHDLDDLFSATEKDEPVGKMRASPTRNRHCSPKKITAEDTYKARTKTSPRRSDKQETYTKRRGNKNKSLIKDFSEESENYENEVADAKTAGKYSIAGQTEKQAKQETKSSGIQKRRRTFKPQQSGTDSPPEPKTSLRTQQQKATVANNQVTPKCRKTAHSNPAPKTDTHSPKTRRFERKNRDEDEDRLLGWRSVFHSKNAAKREQKSSQVNKRDSPSDAGDSSLSPDERKVIENNKSRKSRKRIVANEPTSRHKDSKNAAKREQKSSQVNKRDSPRRKPAERPASRIPVMPRRATNSRSPKSRRSSVDDDDDEEEEEEEEDISPPSDGSLSSRVNVLNQLYTNLKKFSANFGDQDGRSPIGRQIRAMNKMYQRIKKELRNSDVAGDDRVASRVNKQISEFKRLMQELPDVLLRGD
ncbi:unnamed protein product [Notodromas monacha]|uniref:Uncharacterized protein n=1 Tax=Notodromas monacha TaxID=399045 RepID=A0A7R9GC45_9CRUS|nr:unnamed protein product [Notodromas monacha]CAG0915461.1 unnamed protein product [Notodromas monacha]